MSDKDSIRLNLYIIDLELKRLAWVIKNTENPRQRQEAMVKRWSAVERGLKFYEMLLNEYDKEEIDDGEY